MTIHKVNQQGELYMVRFLNEQLAWKHIQWNLDLRVPQFKGKSQFKWLFLQTKLALYLTYTYVSI